MSNFKIIKRGYSQLEVDAYIDRLKNDYETKLSEQKDRIFYLKDQLEKLTNSSDNELMTSLVSAVERAKIIENSSKNIYELETKKLSLLYSKMEKLLKDENVYNDINIKNELLLLIQDCRNSLQNNISVQDKKIKESEFSDPVKKLLSKMINFNKVDSELSIKNASTNEIIDKYNIDKSNLVSPIAEVGINAKNKAVSSQSNAVNIAPQQIIKKAEIQKEKPVINEFNKFLSQNDNLTGANFENIMFFNKTLKQQNEYVLGGDLGDLKPNETGFDLKEAVNPKEDLDEIMKAFDFYNDDKKKK